MAVDEDLGGGTVTAWPTSYTLSQTTSPDVSSAGRGATAGRNLAAATDNPGTFTWSASDEWIAYTVVVRPAAAPGQDGGGATP